MYRGNLVKATTFGCHFYVKTSKINYFQPISILKRQSDNELGGNIITITKLIDKTLS